MRLVPKIYLIYLKTQIGFKEITLITCNNSNGKRLIIKAKETDD